MKWFHFSQNNSGGSFVSDEHVTNHVLIEAENARRANDKAETIGIYFNGCSEGIDCPCCGDRWYPAHQADGRDEPLIYGKRVTVAEEMFREGPYKAIIYHHDGHVERIPFSSEE